MAKVLTLKRADDLALRRIKVEPIGHVFMRGTKKYRAVMVHFRYPHSPRKMWLCLGSWCGPEVEKQMRKNGMRVNMKVMAKGK